MADPERLTITDGVVAATITPTLGAGLSCFDYVGNGTTEPIFKPGPDRGPLDPAMFLLLPFSNRISGGGFTFRGAFHRLAPNVPGEPYPIHGDGYGQAWLVDHADATSARLRLTPSGVSPFRYAAVVNYATSDGALTAELTLENLGFAAMPFGLGFHPWVVRTGDTRLLAPASGVWLETKDHLRAGEAPVPLPQEWDFSRPQRLPPGFINNGFSDWRGMATIAWPGRGLRLDIAASPALSTYIIYSPGASADFFCFEPVSHPVDAHNLREGDTSGLVVLEPHASVRANVAFTVSR